MNAAPPSASGGHGSGRGVGMRRVAAAWRPAARLARREVRRRPWRTALVVTLIALPVAAATFASIFARTVNPTAEERRAATFGQADDVVHDDVVYNAAVDIDRSADELAASIAPAFPAGSRILAFTTGHDAVIKPDGHLENSSYTDQPLDEPLLEGTMHLVDGQAPRNADEVAVSAEVLDHADAEVGDRIELFLLGEVEVTGEVIAATTAQQALVVGTVPATSAYDSAVAHVDAPPGFTGPDVAVLAGAGASSVVQNSDIDGYGDPRDVVDRPTTIYLFGGVALVAMAIIATAAFAVAARRQLRLLGLLSAVGVPPEGLRRTVLLQGSVCGLVGSVIGVALGTAAALAGYPYVNEIASDYVDALVLHPFDLLVPLLLGTVAATGAAALPAVTAGRVPVLAALAGRKPQGPLPHRVPVGGIVAVGLGAVLLATYARDPELGWGYAWVGATAILLGACALAPWVVSHTEPLARRLRGGARVAARDLARQRLRAGSVVAAVMVPAGLAVLAATLIASAAVADARRDTPDQDTETEELRRAIYVAAPGAPRTDTEVEAGLDEVRAALPDAAEVDILRTIDPRSPDLLFVSLAVRAPVADGRTSGCAEAAVEPGAGWWIVVNDPAELRAAGMPAERVEALEDGKALVDGPRPVGAEYCIALPTAVAVDAGDIVEADLVAPYGPIAIVSPDTAARWGMSTAYYGTLFRNPEPLNDDEREAVDDSASSCGPVADCWDRSIRDQLLGRTETAQQPGDDVLVAYPSTDSKYTPGAQAAVAGGILVFTLLIVAVALSLAAAETRDERALLDAVGASPSVRRSIVAWQAGLLPGLAMLLAVPGGLAVALALTVGDPFRAVEDFRIPWVTVTLLGLGVPLVSAAVAWLATSVTARRHRDLSTLALAAD